MPSALRSFTIHCNRYVWSMDNSLDQFPLLTNPLDASLTIHTHL